MRQAVGIAVTTLTYSSAHRITTEECAEISMMLSVLAFASLVAMLLRLLAAVFTLSLFVRNVRGL